MNFLSVAAGSIGKLVVAAVFGFALLRPALGGLTLPEKIAWAAGAGSLVEMASTLVAILFGGPDPFWLVAGGAAVLSLLPRRKPTPAPTPPRRIRWIDAIVLGAAAAGLIAFSLIAISEPLWTNDYVAIWGLKAKTIALTHAVPRELLHDASYSYSHPEYPLGFPLTMAWLSWARWNDHALAVVFPWFAAASIAAVAGFCLRRSSVRGAAVGAALVALFFSLFRASNVGLAEIPFALAAVLLASAFLDIEAEADWRSIARLAVAALLAALLKREGSLLAIVFAAAAVAAPVKRLMKWRAVTALLLPAAALEGLQRLLPGRHVDRDFQGAAALVLGRGELPARLWRVARAAATELPLVAVVGIAALALFFAVTPRVPEDRVIPPIVVQMTIYALACAFYAGDPAFLVHTALGRIASAILPVLALAVGARTAALSKIRAVSATFHSRA
jgi:hypothetical protein